MEKFALTIIPYRICLKFDNYQQSNKILYLMEQKATPSIMHKMPQKEHILGQERGSKAVGQEQNLDKKSNTCSLNQNIENSLGGSGRGQNQQKKKRQMKSLLLWKCLFLAIIISQFSILTALILIQYFSSKIQPTSLALLLPFPVILSFLFIVSLWGIERAAIEQVLSVAKTQEDVGSSEVNEAGTVLKINQEMCKRSNAKTKKVQFPNLGIVQHECTQQTIKKVEGQSPKQPQKTTSLTFGTRRRLIVACRTILSMLNIIIASLSLYSNYSHGDSKSKIAMALSILMYSLSIGPCVLVYLFLKRINIFMAGRKEEMKPDEQMPQQAPKTKVSIDKQVATETVEKKSCLSIQRQIKLAKVVEGEGEGEGQPAIGHSKQGSNKMKSQEGGTEQICRQLTKRSVLKNKMKKPSIKEMGEQQQTIERRRVQINSKKIQYFQYAQISPSHSVIEDENTNKHPTSNKYKYYLHKIASRQQKIEIEEMILKGKKLARQKKVQSEGCLSRKKEVREEERFCADYFC